MMLVASNVKDERSINDFSVVMANSGYSMMDLIILMLAATVPAWVNLLGIALLWKNHG